MSCQLTEAFFHWKIKKYESGKLVWKYIINKDISKYIYNFFRICYALHYSEHTHRFSIMLPGIKTACSVYECADLTFPPLPLSLSHANTEREGDRHTTKKVMRLAKTEYTYEFEGWWSYFSRCHQNSLYDVMQSVKIIKNGSNCLWIRLLII